MTDSTSSEPENSSYAAVLIRDRVWVYRRDDAFAQAEGDDYNWVLVSGLEENDDGSPCTWAELCGFGMVAYVGKFIDRCVPTDVLVNADDLRSLLAQRIQHCHLVPGAWDRDNGQLAGKPCTECAARTRLQQAIDTALTALQQGEEA